MDFGRPMVCNPGVVAKSNIRLVPETYLGDDPLDILVCQASNDAAKDLFLGNDNPSSDSTKKDTSSEPTNDTEKHLSRVDHALYAEHHLPAPRPTIQPGDLVVVFESFNDLNFVYATPNEVFSNRNGHFPHHDFISKPYGCKIRSKNNNGLGFLYLLRPTPELWARSLPHRTQIVHELDASMIVHYLNLIPNMVVCESGTGSGAMSHVILRSIAPKGKLHTYEFNKIRADKARVEFQGHGLGHLVEVHHRDVCGKKALLNMNQQESNQPAASDETETDEIKDKDSADDGKGGFQLGESAAHAIFLDLPEPWLAVKHAAFTLKTSGRICSYSPCMEQTQRTVVALKQYGFHSIQTVEARLKEYFVDEVEMEAPPTVLPAIPTEETATLEKERHVAGGVLPKEDSEVNSDIENAENKLQPGAKKRKLCARPFSQMRGHTAFLTFATAGGSMPRIPDKSSM
ncbi:hypothetical protein HJC23_000429 [Cyclotella cryptica]|uniref:tRNA (adenine(58)-N(1))-methyltransferase n=1 Tax=Cyclotella cryptica TaxID=29204 RepID=A0ABD3QC72_9STRA|eukprot:CCRYP_007173-RA/>CCRYP_007173-RA protein AED:0.02 eAED:0.02 QI:0/-1/0/1/-1/1/1/0/457